MLTIEQLIAQWLPPPSKYNIQALATHSGLSGAKLWKITSHSQQFCLRRWPEHVPKERLDKIHRLLLHLDNRGSQHTPTPLPTLHGETLVQSDNSHWELTAWLPGEAINQANPSPLHIQAALEKLAEIHLLATSDSAGAVAVAPWQQSPGLAQRRDILQRAFLVPGRRQLANCPPSLAASLKKALDLLSSTLDAIHREAAQASQLPLPMQWRIGDIHREHVLFTENSVTGIVDFGAAGIDSPVADVARLLGSLAGDEAELWNIGLAAYQSVRPLAEEELAVVAAFDAGGVAAAVIRWNQWLSVEQRDFPSEKVHSRLKYLACRLESLAKRGRVGVI